LWRSPAQNRGGEIVKRAGVRDVRSWEEGKRGARRILSLDGKDVYEGPEREYFDGVELNRSIHD